MQPYRKQELPCRPMETKHYWARRSVVAPALKSAEAEKPKTLPLPEIPLEDAPKPKPKRKIVGSNQFQTKFLLVPILFWAMVASCQHQRVTKAEAVQVNEKQNAALP